MERKKLQLTLLEFFLCVFIVLIVYWEWYNKMAAVTVNHQI